MGHMGDIVTLKERKAAAVERKCQALDAMRPALRSYARAHCGRFLLFGSAARGTLRRDSDVDILTDFPEHETAAAWNFAERACWDRGLDPDVMPRAWCKADFLAHIERDIEVIG
jgi:predicted nucleotidyltransferase